MKGNVEVLILIVVDNRLALAKALSQDVEVVS